MTRWSVHGDPSKYIVLETIDLQEFDNKKISSYFDDNKR
jgi:hypothetical protein